MQFDILTLFPNSFSYLKESIVKRAQEKELIQINIHDLRKWSTDKHHKVDDKPFGGGVGMLMQVEPIYRALKELGVYPVRDEKTKILLTSARGDLWNQNSAREYAQSIERVVIICGHYEGFDARVLNMIDEEISVGQYVLSGGELPSMIITDSIIRLLEGSLGSFESIEDETFSDENLQNKEYPQYTRPETFTTDEGEEWKAPDVLLSGNHKEIENWKKENSL